ncbi:MAG: hypothetical protein J2P38_00410 [Candidatus Dormibacteraeota bacterium]|nr:hypothetical protein [Candidatus Dormibacteraeota bacterium]
MLELAGTTPLVLDANPISAPIEWIVGSIGTYLQGLDPGRAVLDPLRLLVPLGGHPVAAAAHSPLAAVTPSCGTCGFGKIASSIRGIGYVLLAFLLLARMLKLAATGQLRSPEHVLFDLVPKLMFGTLLIQYFDRVVNDLGRMSMAGAFLLEDALLGPIGAGLKGVLSAFPTDGLGLVLLPILYVLILYLLLLVVTSRLVLLLGALISPLGIPIALNNGQGRLAGSWVRMIVSSLLVPVLAGIGTAGSLALAWLVHQVTGNGPVLGSYLGALTGETGLMFTAFVTTAMFKDVVKQGVAGMRGSLEATHMGAVTGSADELLSRTRQGAGMAVGAGFAATGAGMVGAGVMAKAARKGRDSRSDGPDPEPAPEVPRLPGAPDAGSLTGPRGAPALPGGRGETGRSQPRLPAPPHLALLPGRREETDPDSQLMLPEPPRPVTERRHIDGGQIIYAREIAVREVVHYAVSLSEPAGGPIIDQEPRLVKEV